MARRRERKMRTKKGRSGDKRMRGSRQRWRERKGCWKRGGGKESDEVKEGGVKTEAASHQIPSFSLLPSYLLSSKNEMIII